MKSNCTDQQIIDLIRAGKSYTDIIALLHISPMRITVLKKRMQYAENAEKKKKVQRNK